MAALVGKPGLITPGHLLWTDTAKSDIQVTARCSCFWSVLLPRSKVCRPSSHSLEKAEAATQLAVDPAALLTHSSQARKSQVVLGGGLSTGLKDENCSVVL